MKKSRIGEDVLAQRSVSSCAKSQQIRLIRVRTGTTQCCPSAGKLGQDGARRGESLVRRTLGRTSLEGEVPDERRKAEAEEDSHGGSVCTMCRARSAQEDDQGVCSDSANHRSAFQRDSNVWDDQPGNLSAFGLAARA